MATIRARLNRLLKARKPATVARFSTVSQPPAKTQIPVSVKQLVNEPDLGELVKKFKQRATESLSFRHRHNIYDFTIARLAIAKQYNLIEDILESHKDFEEITHEGFAIRLIRLYGKAGMFDHARKIFDEMPERNCTRTVKSLNALIKAGVECKRFDEVGKIFREMSLEFSINLDCSWYNTMIHALCEMGSLDDALLMVGEMKAKGLSPNVITFNTLLDAFYRERGFEGGERIWNMMVEDNVVCNTRSYNLKIQATVNLGELDSAVDLFGTLEKEGLKPDVNTFNALIKGFCDQGNVEEAKGWFNSLVESGGTPNRITFSILITMVIMSWRLIWARRCSTGNLWLTRLCCSSLSNCW